MRLRVVLLVYLALFVGDLSWTGITPLIPSYIEQYSLTAVEGGLVLSIASLGILVASLPAGYLTRRASPRALTMTSMVFVALGGFAMTLSSSYVAILASRLVFGLGFGTLWVAMAAWLADAAGPQAPKVLAGTTAVVGVSSMLGPTYAGWMAQHFSLSTPFVGLAAITTVLFVLLLLDRSGTGLRKDPAPPLRDLARAATRDPDLVTMLLLTIAAAVVWMTADLLVPLRLDAGGYDIAHIGVLFSVASLTFIVSSTITARAADRWARPGIAAGATAGLAAACLVPALFLGVPASLVFLVGAALATGITVSLTYPFGLYAVERGAVTVAVMSALANIIWALAGMAGPSLGGAFAEWAGDRMAFALLAVLSLVVAVVVVRKAQPSVTS